MPAQAPSRFALVGVLALAVLAVSLAAPLIRLTPAPAEAIAFWRMAFTTAVTGALWAGGAGRSWGGIRYGWREWALAALSGLFLGVHFAAWIKSLSYTSVAASVVLVNTQPVFVAIFASFFLGERASRVQWCGIVLAVAGAAVISLGAQETGPGSRPLAGNLLALAGAVTAAAYYVIGRSLRQKTPLWAYVTRVYGFSAALLLAVALVSKTPLSPYPARAWVIFAALVVGPTLLGHTLLNWSLRWLKAAVVNVAALGEPVLASLFAALLPAIEEVPGPLTLCGGALTLVGIALVLRRG